jgi:hypothetical protein
MEKTVTQKVLMRNGNADKAVVFCELIGFQFHVLVNL